MDRNIDLGSSCDIFFDEESRTLRNSKDEVLAYFKDGAWVPLQENFCGTYSRPLQMAILTTLVSYKNGLEVEDLLLKLQQKFSEVKKQNLARGKVLEDVSIALDVSAEEVDKIQSKLARLLSKEKITYQRIKNPHVSTAYLIGQYDYSYLVDTLKLLSNFEFKFKASKIEILKGATTKKDYIVLLLEPDEYFLKAVGIIEKESDIIKFSGGFKTHVSLFCVNQGSLKLEELEGINSLILGKSMELTHLLQIKPKAISLFNKDRLLELRQKIRSKL